jgi:hypothetical protein
MTRRVPADIEKIEIFPDNVYRTTLGYPLIGLGPDQVRKGILDRTLPTPHRPTPNSKYEVWTGQQILDYRAERQRIAAQELEAERKNPTPQPPQLAKVNDRPRPRKVKLRTAAKLRERERQTV